MMNSDCARRGPDGNRVRVRRTMDSICGNATLTIEKPNAGPKFCGGSLWHDYPMSGTIGAKTKLGVNDARDSSRNSVSGAWGDDGAGDVVGNDQEIVIETTLPHELKIKVRGWGGVGIWRYRKHFGFEYDGQSWTEETIEESRAHCVQTVALGTAENRNRYKHGWDFYR